MTHDQPDAVPPFETGAWTPGQAPAGQPAYGQTPLGQAPYGQAPYGQAQPAYGQPQYGQPVQPSGTDGMSIAALVTGLLGLGAVPLALGIVGLKRTRANGTSGRGMAIAGIVLGGISIVAYLVLALAVLVGGLAFSQAETNSGTVSGPVAGDPVETLPSDEGADGTAMSDTPLLDFVPLTVDTFTTTGLVEESSVLDAGALEAYTATYTDGTSTVLTYVTDWSSAEESLVFATAVGSAFLPEQLVDSGDASTDGSAQYWAYDLDGVLTIVAVNDSVALTMTGPADAVYALYSSFPL